MKCAATIQSLCKAHTIAHTMSIDRGLGAAHRRRLVARRSRLETDPTKASFVTPCRACSPTHVGVSALCSGAPDVSRTGQSRREKASGLGLSVQALKKSEGAESRSAEALTLSYPRRFVERGAYASKTRDGVENLD